MSEEKKKVAIVPFTWKKFKTKKGTSIMAIFAKRDKPHHFKGSMKTAKDEGYEIVKEYTNTEEEADKLPAAERRTTYKKKEAPKPKEEKAMPSVIVESKVAPITIKGGSFLSKIPIIGNLLDSILGGAKSGELEKMGSIKVDKTEINKMKKFTKKSLMDFLKDKKLPDGITKEDVWLAFKQLKTNIDVKGGLLTLPFFQG